MRFFVDSVDPNEIRTCDQQGIIDGVSIGASLGGADRAVLIERICEIFKGPVNAEVADHPAWVSDGGQDAVRALARIAPQVVVKLPFSDEGLKVVRACSAEGIKTHLTGCRSSTQALQAAQAGAAYVSPVADCQDDRGCLDLVRKTVAVYKTYGMATQVLVTSVHSIGFLIDVALAGAEVATVPYSLLQQIIERRG